MASRVSTATSADRLLSSATRNSNDNPQSNTARRNIFRPARDSSTTASLADPLTAWLRRDYTPKMITVGLGRRFPWRFFLIVAASALSVGCKPTAPRTRIEWLPGDPPGSTGASATAGELLSGGTPTGQKVHVVHLVFDVMRVDVPVDTIRHSRKIWNHVDEVRIDPRLVARLSRNGLRVGAVGEEAWPAIRTVLDACDARARTDQVHPQTGLPVTIAVAAVEEGESIFAFGRDHRLVGKTFPGGEKLVHVHYLYRPELGGCTDVQVNFEVRRDHGGVTWEQQDAVIRQVPRYDSHVFADLTVPLTLRPHECVIIGPSEKAENDCLIGSRFFARTESGACFETLFCVTPRPYQARGGESRPL